MPVNGSVSIVHQIHALVSAGCLKIKARVLGVSVREEARAVVLVDVYLPIEVWSGWQFPKRGALAASLFKHVRYLFGNFKFGGKLVVINEIVPSINNATKRSLN